MTSKIVVMTTAKAEKMLKTMVYDRQRTIRNVQISHFHRALHEGVFRPATQICVAIFNKRHILIDGWHRLTAIMETGVTVPVTVTTYHCTSIEQVHRLYITFDTNGGLRKKADLFVALYGHKATAGLGRKVIEKMISASMIISSFFEQQIIRIQSHHISLVLGCAKRFLSSMQKFVKLLQGQMGRLRSETLLSPSVLSVALTTMEWSFKKAKAFWDGVAHNGVSGKNDPRQALREFLIELQSTRRNVFNHRKGVRSFTPREISHIVAWCWNAFYNGDEVSQINVEAAATKTPIHIAGTPFRYSRESKLFSNAMAKYGLRTDIKEYAARGSTGYGKSKAKVNVDVKVAASTS
jgi:hypothetical protein